MYIQPHITYIIIAILVFQAITLETRKRITTSPVTAGMINPVFIVGLGVLEVQRCLVATSDWNGGNPSRSI